MGNVSTHRSRQCLAKSHGARESPSRELAARLLQRVNKCAANVVLRDKDPYERKALKNIVSRPDAGSKA